jgi:hypothetical protein
MIAHGYDATVNSLLWLLGSITALTTFVIIPGVLLVGIVLAVDKATWAPRLRYRAWRSARRQRPIRP